MNIGWRFVVLAIGLGTAVGCSNRPIAGTLDCLFPSKVKYKTDPIPRPGGDPFEPIGPRTRTGLPPLQAPPPGRIGAPSETDVPFVPLTRERGASGTSAPRGRGTMQQEALPVPDFIDR